MHTMKCATQSEATTQGKSHYAKLVMTTFTAFLANNQMKWMQSMIIAFNFSSNTCNSSLPNSRAFRSVHVYPVATGIEITWLKGRTPGVAMVDGEEGGWEGQGDTVDGKKIISAALQQYRCLYKSELPSRQCPTSKCVITGGSAGETLQSEYSDIHSHQKPGGVEISTRTNMHKLSIN